MLKPTLREKKHYLAIEILSKGKLSLQLIRESIEKNIKDFLGDKGVASSGMQILELKHAKDHLSFYSVQGIISMDRKKTLDIRASLTFIKEIGENKASCRVMGVSGTIKRLREKFLS